MRIKARWEALDKEMVGIAYAKASGRPFIPETFSNGDSRKQLLARSRYLLFKKESLWSESQRVRAKILFREYPEIKKAYYLSMRLGLIYHQAKTADVALTRLAHWYDQVNRSGFLSFGSIARTIQSHYLNIVNFFHQRSTNAASEAFNAKIKAFRRQFRGLEILRSSFLDSRTFMLNSHPSDFQYEPVSLVTDIIQRKNSCNTLIL